MKPFANAPTAAVMAAAAIAMATMPGAGRTQPVEGGPDPSTIQGQTQMQNDQYQQQEQQREQQSNQQDQEQQRQERQDQQYDQQPYQGGGRQGAPRADNGVVGSSTCSDQLAARREFAPIAHKVNLNRPNLQPNPMFQITAKPTAAEATLLLKWMEGRKYCLNVDPGLTSNASAADFKMNRTVSQTVNQMIVMLAADKISYGMFNQERANFSRALVNYMATH